ncbi:immunity 49 family protein [Nocardia sp. alder85J]|uniref:immunity 49 family protein n=1 Tax=Nocardia sp. alder85J TaxID=2862949 RepID=UPI001CD24539|nr:immunity 49 family protein [Nocardia sp. alder85J]MCX4096109.1 immunity 49 family protein [Nocardia sp. alder85J]
MTVIVERHPIDLSAFEGRADKYAGHLTGLLPLLETMPDKFVFVCSLAESLLSVQLLTDPEGSGRPVQETALRSEQATVGLFRVTDAGFAGQTDPVRVRILDTTLAVPAKRNHAATQGKWQDAFWWSRIARDGGAADLLAHFAVDRLRDTGDGSRSSEFSYQWVTILQNAWLRGPGSQAGEVNSLSTVSEVGGREGQRVTDRLIRPPMEVFDALAVQNGEQFNRLLADALTQHRKFFGTARWRNDPIGFLSVPLLALACWAHDLGLPVDVESDYIPRHFIENPDWATELAATSTQP